jgi:hypothetical protein
LRPVAADRQAGGLLDPSPPPEATMGQPSPLGVRDTAVGDVRQVRFCTAPNGTRIAYTSTGTGPALLVPAAWISHLELLWQDPAYRAFFLPLAAARTVVQYDRPDCGLSGPWPGTQDCMDRCGRGPPERASSSTCTPPWPSRSTCPTNRSTR